jgi:K+-transporting ATPase KdpF subunit
MEVNPVDVLLALSVVVMLYLVYVLAHPERF